MLISARSMLISAMHLGGKRMNFLGLTEHLAGNRITMAGRSMQMLTRRVPMTALTLLMRTLSFPMTGGSDTLIGKNTVLLMAKEMF